MRSAKFSAVFVGLLLAGQCVAGQPTPRALISGKAVVLEGDLVQISGEKVRLEGVDAMDPGQRCGIAPQDWACGDQATKALEKHLNGRSLACKVRGVDNGGRLLARCKVGSEDLQRWLVRSGWALAFRRYSLDYAADERYAASRKIGVWQGPFDPPWKWRQARR
jgi:endonuclease YncB( thermonuclease family)